MADDNKFSYFFLGLGVGVAVGVLFAPKSGAETRELLKSKADEGKEYIKRQSHDLKETAGDYIERGKQSVLRQKEQVAAAVDAGRQAYRDSVAGTHPSSPALDDIGPVEGI